MSIDHSDDVGFQAEPTRVYLDDRPLFSRHDSVRRARHVWAARNPEAKREAQKRWRDANRTHMREYQRQYRKNRTSPGAAP